MRRFEGHTQAVCDVVALAPDHIVSASVDNTLRLWDISTGKELARFEGDAAFTNLSAPNDHTLAARDSLARLHFFDVRVRGLLPVRMTA